jgi:hypothetical protein
MESLETKPSLKSQNQPYTLKLAPFVDPTEARKSATPRSADIRENDGVSGMQRGV